MDSIAKCPGRRDSATASEKSIGKELSTTTTADPFMNQYLFPEVDMPSCAQIGMPDAEYRYFTKPLIVKRGGGSGRNKGLEGRHLCCCEKRMSLLFSAL